MQNGAQLSTRTTLTDRAEPLQLLAVHVLAGRFVIAVAPRRSGWLKQRRGRDDNRHNRRRQ